MAVLADFGAALQLPSGPVWPLYGGGGWLAPATGLGIGTDLGGRPLAHLSLTRAALPGRPPDPFAMLDITVTCRRDLDAALVELRALRPGATLTPLGPDRCQIALGDTLLSAPGGDAVDMLSSGRSRMIRGLSWEGGLALEAMWQAGDNPLLLSGAACFAGVSPRVGATVGFDHSLLTALAPRLPASAFTRDALEAVLLAGVETLPISGTAGVTGSFRDALCAALADRVYDLLTEPVGHDTEGRPLGRLVNGIEPTSWDLLQPHLTTRWLSLSTLPDDPLDSYLAAQNGAGLVTRSVLPVFPKTRHRLDCHVNFPAHAPGVHALGVTAQSPARPPHRPAAATATGLLDPDRGSLPLTLNLSPGEALDYMLSCFCVVDTPSGVQQFFGAAQQRGDRLPVLSPADFGVRIYQVDASAPLPDLASLALTCRYGLGEQTVTQEVPVTAIGTAIIVPLEATDGTMTLTATADGTTLAAEDMPLRSMTFSAHLFSGYGPQTVTITMAVSDAGTHGVEVQAGGGDIQALAFNRDTGTRSYSYFAASPFDAGFRYRRLGETDWQHHPDPQVPLTL